MSAKQVIRTYNENEIHVLCSLYFSNKRYLAALEEKDYLHTLYITFFSLIFSLELWHLLNH